MACQALSEPDGRHLRLMEQFFDSCKILIFSTSEVPNRLREKSCNPNNVNVFEDFQDWGSHTGDKYLRTQNLLSCAEPFGAFRL
jgi:hypothetical protein